MLRDRPLVMVKCGGVDPASTLGSPSLTGGGVLGKDCSIYAHPSCATVSSSQTAKAVVAVVTHFPRQILDLRLRHLSLALL